MIPSADQLQWAASEGTDVEPVLVPVPLPVPVVPPVPVPLPVGVVLDSVVPLVVLPVLKPVNVEGETKLVLFLGSVRVERGASHDVSHTSDRIENRILTDLLWRIITCSSKHLFGPNWQNFKN